MHHCLCHGSYTGAKCFARPAFVVVLCGYPLPFALACLASIDPCLAMHVNAHPCESGAGRAWPIAHPLCAACRLLGRTFLGKHNLEGMQASRGQQCRWVLSDSPLATHEHAHNTRTHARPPACAHECLLTLGAQEFNLQVLACSHLAVCIGWLVAHTYVTFALTFAHLCRRAPWMPPCLGAHLVRAVV